MDISEHTLALPAGYEINDLRIQRVLGHGSFSITYLAKDRYLQKEVALKEYFPNDIATRRDDYAVIPKTTTMQTQADYDWGLKCFLEEARILGSFKHPNILGVTRFIEANQTAYIVTQYERGQTFTTHLKELNHAPTETELRQIVMPLLDGLEIVHRKDILHRDIKPNNIYICADDHRPVLIDFGSARHRMLKRNLTTIVTDGYSPPEQYSASAKRQGPWSDIYSMAAVLYRAMTNEIPPSASDRQFVISNDEPDPWEPLANKVGKRYSPRFISAIEKGLALKMHERPQTVAEWRQMFFSQTWTETQFTGMEFVWIDGGCFQMGDSLGEGWPDEQPVHEVCVDGFYMGKYQVTQKQWIQIMGRNPSRFQKGGDYPVENVSWHDAQTFIRKLNRKTGQNFRLPTEAEWEYAASSGGQNEKYAGGDDVASVAWCGLEESGQMTHPVGSKKCNGFDLYDMSGNVWEWCSDWYDKTYYEDSPPDNPKGPEQGSKRVKRGGGWSNFCQNVRICMRGSEAPELKGASLGFRLVLPVEN